MVRRRARCIEVDGLNKGTWTEEEDAKLAAYVKKHGQVNWRALPKLAGLKRCGKSCRLRWINYLRPDVKRGNFTKDEEEIIIRLHALLGNKWSKISSCLPGRTDNEIKNMWHTHLKKRLIQAAGKSSSSAPPPRKIKTRRLTQAACDNNGAAAVGSGAAGLIEKLLTSLPKPCPSYSTDLETKESTVRCMEQGQSQHILSSDHVLNCSAMESCVASPELLHDQPWWPLQQEQQYLYGHAVDQGDSYCQMIEMYSLSVDPEEVWRHMEEDNYCLLPPSTPVAPDQVLVDSVQGAGCSNIINVPSWSTSSCSSTWDEEKDQWLEYLEKELEL